MKGIRFAVILLFRIGSGETTHTSLFWSNVFYRKNITKYANTEKKPFSQPIKEYISPLTSVSVSYNSVSQKWKSIHKIILTN